MMSIIVNSLSYIHPNGETLFDNLHLSLYAGQKVALVGNNGAGKSTLLRLIAGELQPTSGGIDVRGNTYFVPQHLKQFDQCTVADVLHVQSKLDALHAILSGDVSENHFITLQEDWNIEERIATALSLWNLGHVEPSQKMGSLSGGEKTKVHLAGITLHQPEGILLDEPSNHLDAPSRAQLYEFLGSVKATTLIASHDRTLLHLVDVTLELDHGQIEIYGGSYDFYEKQKKTQLSALESSLHEHEKTLKKAKEKAQELAAQRQKREVRGKADGQKGSLPRIIAGGRKVRAEESTARIADAQADKTERIKNEMVRVRQEIRNDLILKTEFHPSGAYQGKVLFDAPGINFGFDGMNLWKHPLNFLIRSGDRVRINGDNGSGKTTLLKILSGQLHPSGSFHRADLEYMYLDQEYSVIDNTLSVLEQVQCHKWKELAEHEVKTVLHQHQFSSASWDRKCGDLSGGEKMKLALCCIALSAQTPDVLILDEPTNNLDQQSQQVLIHAVKRFEGTLIAVSHDPFFWKEIDADTVINL